jgi:4-hydroxy-tetrahydrodipicolinate synthase
MSTISRTTRFGRLMTAMITPFTRDGEIDLDGAVELAHYLVAHGNDGLVVCGSTGESSVLSDDERVALWEAVTQAVDVPVIAGSTSNDTIHSVGLTKRAEAAGVAGILAVTPYYNRPAQSGIEGHFRAIAQATSLPVILYDIPIRSGRKIANETVLRLIASEANVIGLKDATGDPVTTAKLMNLAPDDFEIYCGDDGLTLPFLSIGAVGLISVAAHWVGGECKEMIELFLAGKVDEAVEINRALIDSFTFESSDDGPNPVPTKEMMRVLNLPGGSCRLPLGEAPAGLYERAEQVNFDLETWRKTRGLHA